MLMSESSVSSRSFVSLEATSRSLLVWRLAVDDVSFSIEGVATDERDESLRLALHCEWMRRFDSTPTC